MNDRRLIKSKQEHKRHYLRVLSTFVALRLDALFCSSTREELKAKDPRLKYAELSRMCQDLWKLASEEDREVRWWYPPYVCACACACACDTDYVALSLPSHHFPLPLPLPLTVKAKHCS